MKFFATLLVVWMYTNAGGVPCFTDEYARIPVKYRAEAVEVSFGVLADYPRLTIDQTQD